MGRFDVIDMTINLMSGMVILNIVIPASKWSWLEINTKYLYMEVLTFIDWYMAEVHTSFASEWIWLLAISVWN